MKRRVFLLGVPAAGLGLAFSGGLSNAQDAAGRTPSIPTPLVDGSYVLGPGDKLRMNVFGEEPLSGEFVVSGSGIVSLPLVGEVTAAGLTLDGFREAVVKALMQGYLLNPRVSVEVLTYRPFYILGEVARPGEYPYISGLTILNAIATAGGYTYRANTRRVFVRAANAAEETAYRLDATLTVNPGDTIRVAERFF